MYVYTYTYVCISITWYSNYRHMVIYPNIFLEQKLNGKCFRIQKFPTFHGNCCNRKNHCDENM